MLSINKYKLKYLKYKKKYTNYKNNLLNLYGGRPESYEVVVEESVESDISEIISHELIDRYIFRKERIIMDQEQSIINNMINNFFISNRYLQFINSIINSNIKKIYDYILDKFGFNIENLKKEVDSLIGDIVGIRIGLEKARETNNEKRIKELEEKLCIKMENKEKFINNYKLSMLIKRLFMNFFKTYKDVQDNTLGERYEEFVNTLIKETFTRLKLPILYLCNINCISDKTSVSIFPQVPVDNKEIYQKMKAEIDGMILIKRNKIWYPIMILEMKNNMELILKDFNKSKKLLEMLKELTGIKEITVDKKKFNINLDGFKDVYFLYCINNIKLQDSRFHFTNFEKIKTIIQIDLNKIIKELPNNNKFISSMKLSNYVLDSLEDNEYNDFSEEEEIKDKIKELMERKEETKYYDLPDVLEDINIKSIQVEEELSTRPIMNAYTLVESTKIYEKVEEEASNFMEFFSNPKHLILHIPIS
jgi:hypothetical protein